MTVELVLLLSKNVESLSNSSWRLFQLRKKSNTYCFMYVQFVALHTLCAAYLGSARSRGRTDWSVVGIGIGRALKILLNSFVGVISTVHFCSTTLQ